jgi:hypothetical protein
MHDRPLLISSLIDHVGKLALRERFRGYRLPGLDAA